MKLEALKIDQFRGIRDLELNNMEDVNIILGDNDVFKVKGRKQIINAQENTKKKKRRKKKKKKKRKIKIKIKK